MIGSELKNRREQLGLSQEKLARELDVAVSTVARLEQLRDKEIPNSRLYEFALEQIEEKLEMESSLDGFELLNAIEELDEPIAVMRAWYEYEGRTAPEDLKVHFFNGWGAMAKREKIDSLRFLKRFIDSPVEPAAAAK